MANRRQHRRLGFRPTDRVDSHARRWAAHQTITDLADALTAQHVRHHLQRRGPVTTAQIEQIEQRQLSDYDAAFGLAIHDASVAEVA